MKKSILVLVLGAALALVGCSKQEGGTTDTYSTATDRGASRSTMTNSADTTLTATNTSSQGGATTPSSTSSGAGTSTPAPSTNSSSPNP